MKKILFFAVAVAAFFSSCTKEHKEQAADDSTVYADVDRTDDATKVVMGRSDGTHTSLNWNKGDEIGVYNVNSKTFGAYQTASSVKDGDATAAFSFVVGDKIVPDEPHLAGYPFERIASDSFAFQYCTTQDYTTNSFDRLAMPMIAVNQSGTSFTFKVQAAVLRLQVSTLASDVTVSSIVVTSKDKNLTGWALPDWEHYTYGVPSSSVGKEVSLNCESPVAIGGTAKDFNIVVPGQEYPSEDLKITIHTNKGEIVKTSKKAVTFVSGKVYNIPVSCEPTPVPEGALPGKFSVAAGKQVYFSQGNLQYVRSENKWQFAAAQYETVETNGQDVGVDNANMPVQGLFGWGTSGYNHGAVCYQPWSTTPGESNYYAYGVKVKNLYDEDGRADWGYNAISNGGNKENCGWRTLTIAYSMGGEWGYLLTTRTMKGNTPRYTTTGNSGIAIEGTIYNGLFVYPDDYEGQEVGQGGPDTWADINTSGIVFLPLAGYRWQNDNTVVSNVDDGGFYCSSSYSWNALYITKWGISGGGYGTPDGLSVRLVIDCK